MAEHLTPTEMGREFCMERRDVITKCLDWGVPIYQGRIDKRLFAAQITEGGSMRYRLMHKQPKFANSSSPTDGTFKPLGSVQIADTHEEALERYGPDTGRWLVLCEDDGTFRFLDVKKRTETDIEPVELTELVVGP